MSATAENLIDVINAAQDIGVAIGLAVESAARHCARVNGNGDVIFDDDFIRRRVKNDGEVQQAVEDYMNLIIDDTKDRVTHKRRVEWQKNRHNN